jgi:3-isopropylmalate dehydrogenase
MLRHSLGLTEEADTLEKAVEETLNTGYRTADIAQDLEGSVTTDQMKDSIMDNLHHLFELNGA